MEMLIKRLDTLTLKTPKPSTPKKPDNPDGSFIEENLSDTQEDSLSLNSIRLAIKSRLKKSSDQRPTSFAAKVVDNATLKLALEREHQRCLNSTMNLEEADLNRLFEEPEEGLQEDIIRDLAEDFGDGADEVLEDNNKSLQCLALAEETELDQSLHAVSEIVYWLALSNRNLQEENRRDSRRSRVEEEDLGEDIVRSAIDENVGHLVNAEQKLIIEQNFLQELYTEFGKKEMLGNDTSRWSVVPEVGTPPTVDERDESVEMTPESSGSGIGNTISPFETNQSDGGEPVWVTPLEKVDKDLMQFTPVAGGHLGKEDRSPGEEDAGNGGHLGGIDDSDAKGGHLGDDKETTGGHPGEVDGSGDDNGGHPDEGSGDGNGGTDDDDDVAGPSGEHLAEMTLDESDGELDKSVVELATTMYYDAEDVEDLDVTIDLCSPLNTSKSPKSFTSSWKGAKRCISPIAKIHVNRAAHTEIQKYVRPEGYFYVFLGFSGFVEFWGFFRMIDE